jgi:hypothetical protein
MPSDAGFLGHWKGKDKRITEKAYHLRNNRRQERVLENLYLQVTIAFQIHIKSGKFCT